MPPCRSNPNRQISRFVKLAIGTLISCAAWGPLTAQSTGVPPAETIESSSTQFLVLKTGSVYSGQLEYGGGRYTIHRNNGSSVRFHDGEVDFVTHSLDDAYSRLHQRLDPADVIGHQRLAKWCLKYRQLKNAQRQLAWLKQQPGGDKSIKLLQRQIEEMANPRPEQLPAQLANFQPAPDSGIRRLPRTDSQMASHADLRATIDSFSRESLRDFNRGVHLRIVNGCAAAHCHGDPENPLRLWRVENHGGITSTGVQRNLHSLSRYIDRQNPEQSVLLKYVSEVHAQMDAPAYEPTSHHFHAIRDWVMTTGWPAGTDTDGVDEPVSQAGFTAFPNLTAPRPDGPVRAAARVQTRRRAN